MKIREISKTDVNMTTYTSNLKTSKVFRRRTNRGTLEQIIIATDADFD